MTDPLLALVTLLGDVEEIAGADGSNRLSEAAASAAPGARIDVGCSGDILHAALAPCRRR